MTQAWAILHLSTTPMHQLVLILPPKTVANPWRWQWTAIYTTLAEVASPEFTPPFSFTCTGDQTTTKDRNTLWTGWCTLPRCVTSTTCTVYNNLVPGGLPSENGGGTPEVPLPLGTRLFCVMWFAQNFAVYYEIYCFQTVNFTFTSVLRNI